MEYIKITFPLTEQPLKDEMSALLSDLGFEGFEETETVLMAYVPAHHFDEDALLELTAGRGLVYEQELLPEQNWNATWESNFEPVLIDGFCSVRADFHPQPQGLRYDIVITPKMSFGTGHHATTALMITLMRQVDFDAKAVLDFGTGTGILAILAEKMGAARVLAIDNDEWSVANGRENCDRNQASKVTVRLSTMDQLEEATTYAVILANINRNILLAAMGQMAAMLAPQGHLLMSGILADDADLIKQAAEREGLLLQQQQEQDGWVALLYTAIA